MVHTQPVSQEHTHTHIHTHIHTHTHACTQAVYELYNITPGAPWQPNQEADNGGQSKLVVIGRNLNTMALREWFAQTRAS